jgi:hypothetical protein
MMFLVSDVILPQFHANGRPSEAMCDRDIARRILYPYLIWN